MRSIKKILGSDNRGQQQQTPPASPSPPQQISSSSFLEEMPKRENETSAETEGADAKKLKRENDIATFEAQRDEYTELLKDKTLSPQVIARYEKERALANWELAQLKTPNDLARLEAARQALVDAEVRHEREEEEDKWAKKIAKLKVDLKEADEFFKQTYRTDLAEALSKAKESENSWPTREIELRQKFEQKYAMPKLIIPREDISMQTFVVKSWKEVSHVISNLPFTLNTMLVDVSSQMAVLGSLFLQGTTWPVVRGSNGLSIDMRLMSRKFFDPDGDDLRPAARKLSVIIQHSDMGTFGYIAVPGIGKSSALIDIGREHFVIFIQSSIPGDQGNPMNRKSREYDRNFVEMIEDLRVKTSSKETQSSVKHDNWNIAVHRAQVELVARTLQLVRLYREVGASLTPWMFTVHQMAGMQTFVEDIVEQLRNVDERSLKTILRNTMKELAPLFSETRKFVVAIDEMELARHLLNDRFMRPPGSEDETMSSTANHPKGILSPLCRAVSELSGITLWSLVLAGTGASESSMTALKTDLGKLRLDNIISDASSFPVCQAADAVRLLSCLSISEELRTLLATGLEPSPLHQPARVRAGSTTPVFIKYVLEDYMIGARFRLLCGTIEHIRKCFVSDKSSDDILLMAMQMVIEGHREGLLRLLRIRLDSKDPHAKIDVREADEFLSYLLSIHVAVKLTDGNTRIVRKKVPGTFSTIDLTRLGIAVASEENAREVVDLPGEVFTSYSVRERFVIETIGLLFLRDERVLNHAENAKYRRILGVLSSALEAFGRGIPFKGNLVEKILLDRIVALNREYATLGDLPFVPRNVHEAWKAIPCKAQEVKEAEPSLISTPDFLSSDIAENFVYAPEPACRPDGVLMLPKLGDQSKRRAISLGIAVYSYRVLESKAESQYWSTDLSRSYLSKEGRVYKATQQLRSKWLQKKLHETVSLRVHIHLPGAPSSAEIVKTLYARETTMEGGSRPIPLQTRTADDDVIVNLDRSNIHLLLGPMNGPHQALYELLKIATGVADGWCVRNDVDSSL